MKRKLFVLVGLMLVMSMFAAGCAQESQSESAPAAAEDGAVEAVSQDAAAVEADEKDQPAEEEVVSSADAVTIRFAHQFSDAESEKLDEIIQQFEQDNPDIKIEVERNNEANFYDKLVTSILGEAAPDIARVEPPKAAQYVAAGYASSLDGVFSQEEIDQYFAGALEPLMKDGVLYGVPQDLSTLVLFYRTDLFEQAGIENPPATWNELVADAQLLTQDSDGDGNNDIYGIGLFGGWGAFEFYPWFWQAGGEMFSEDGGSLAPAFNSEAGVNALQFWVDLADEYQVMPVGLANAGEDDVKGPFISGQMAMFTSGPWTVSSLKENTEIEGKWAIAPLPAGVEEASVLGGMDLIVLEQSEHKAEAARFISYLMQDEIQLDWAFSLNLLPVKKSMYEYEAFKDDTMMQVFSQALDVSRTRPTITQAGEIDDAFGQAVQAAMSGGQTAQEALDEAAAKAVEILAQ